MISFRAMLSSEFSDYLAYFIPDYAAEISSSYQIPEEDALQQAQREVAISLANGVDTAGQVLLCIVIRDGGAEKTLGYLWYRPDPTARSAYINDFYIFSDYRGRGFGKRTMKCLEDKLSAEGFIQIKLRVAPDNKLATHVYQSTGFQVTGINMNKILQPHSCS
ncbi:GNAT family N-acetyltransferase [Brenneria izadpanahii]|uniref:GNAT family N-acetyltransferase n=1 Tax=Brenneria izadpanahii TaxID=2722756 RepID=A0ABX7UR14_9GAMM|nr:GNAT family N-acetyltransferase [Brenneria izadpanahii]QTF08166.1 GNAT family N-acetyltransferase [Brenneria izadpanahii]